MKYCEKCLAKNGNFDFFVVTLQTSCGTFRQRGRASCGAFRQRESDVANVLWRFSPDRESDVANVLWRFSPEKEGDVTNVLCR